MGAQSRFESPIADSLLCAWIFKCMDGRVHPAVNVPSASSLHGVGLSQTPTLHPTYPISPSPTYRKEAQRQKMREALGLSAEPTKSKKGQDEVVGDIQITFTSRLSGGKDSKSVFENEP